MHKRHHSKQITGRRIVITAHLQPAPGHIWSRSWILVLFQILRIWCLSSSLASSMLPSVLMDRDVRTRANRVALKLTEPSEFSGMFIDTSRYFPQKKGKKGKNILVWLFASTHLSPVEGKPCREPLAEFSSRSFGRWLSTLCCKSRWSPPS